MVANGMLVCVRLAEDSAVSNPQESGRSRDERGWRLFALADVGSSWLHGVVVVGFSRSCTRYQRLAWEGSNITVWRVGALRKTVSKTSWLQWSVVEL